MATTQNGIYYQDDYTKSADILADMKEMAESIDEVILEEKENQETIEQTIQQIQSNQTTQNQKIEQIDDNQIHITTEKSSNINVKDARGQNAKIKLHGISKQEGTPSSEYPAEIENTEGDIDITDCNKNLFDKNKVTDNNYLNENGELTANTLYCVSDFINVVENETYFLPTRGTSRTKFYNKNKQVLTDTWDVADKDKNFVIPANAKYIRFSINKKTVNIDTFQFERNSIETDYIENQQQTITFPLQEGQKLMKGDYLADDGIHHKRKQIEFDGTENWIADNQASPDTCKGWKIQINDYVGREGEFATIGDLHCSHFIERATYHNEVDGIRGGWGKWIFIKMKVEDLSSPDLTGFKAFLSEQKTNGTPVIVEYELKTEEIEAYTEEQQEAYNQLQNAKTYKTVTNVFTENAELQIDYIADTKTYIDNEINNMKEQLNTINELLSTSNTSAMLLNNMQTDLESEVL